MHEKVFSIQIFQYFRQIPPRVCTLVLFIALVLCYKNDTEKMVICAIVGCYENSKRTQQGISFYRLPAIISHQGNRAQELSQKWRGLWLARIHRGDLGPENIPTPAFVVGILCRVRVRYYAYLIVCMDNVCPGER